MDISELLSIVHAICDNIYEPLTIIHAIVITSMNSPYYSCDCHSPSHFRKFSSLFPPLLFKRKENMGAQRSHDFVVWIT